MGSPLTKCRRVRHFLRISEKLCLLEDLNYLCLRHFLEIKLLRCRLVIASWFSFSSFQYYRDNFKATNATHSFLGLNWNFTELHNI